MLRRMFTALALVAMFASAASAQTVDEIIAKSVAARGGMEKIKAIQTIRMTGKMTVGPGFEAPVIIESRRPNQTKMTFTIQGMNGTQAYDGKVGWAVMPFMGKKDPEPMSADDTKEIADDADIDGPLLDYKAKGNTVELLGKDSVEGTDAWKIKLTLKSGTVRTVYIDADSYLEIKTEGKRTMRGTEMEFEGTIGDYKPVEGVMFPFSLENGVVGHPEKQKVTIDKVEINPKLAADFFAMPAKADSGATVATSPKADEKPESAKATDASAAKSGNTSKKTAKKPATKP